MVKEIFISNECEENCNKYLENISTTYDTGGIWVVRKMGRRLAYICGIKPRELLPPRHFDIDEIYSILCENPNSILDKIDVIKKEIKEILDADRTR